MYGPISSQDVITFTIITSSFTQLIGYNDEILDIALVGNNNSHIAVTTNSEQARVFNRHSLNCQLTLPFSPAVAINVLLSFASIAREALFGISATASIDYKHIIIQTTYSEIIL